MLVVAEGGLEWMRYARRDWSSNYRQNTSQSFLVKVSPLSWQAAVNWQSLAQGPSPRGMEQAEQQPSLCMEGTIYKDTRTRIWVGLVLC